MIVEQLVTVVLAFALGTPHLVHDVTAQVASESRSIMYRLYTSYNYSIEHDDLCINC